jgi:hypothetical protein
LISEVDSFLLNNLRKVAEMKLIVKSLMNWNILLLAFTLAGGLAILSSHQVAHAQSDCIDPATGAACTPTPGPTCGVPGTPPCEPPPPPPPTSPPSRPEPSKTPTPRPLPTRTSTPTATETATATSTATAISTGTATATEFPVPAATSTLVNKPAPVVPPKPVPPQSKQGLWGGIASFVNQWISTLFPDKSASIVINDKLWLTKGIAVQGENNNCVGGTECSAPIRANLGESIRVYIMPEGVKPIIGTKIFGGKYEENFYPALCPGVTGVNGCEEPVFGARPNPLGNSTFPPTLPWQSWFDDILGGDKDKKFKDEFGASLPGSYVIHVPIEWMATPGTYQFTAYINFSQKAFSELIYDNNFITFTIEVGDPTMKNLGILPSPTPTLESSENPYYFDDTLIAVQNGNCIQGCSLTPGWVVAGQPVEVYLQAMNDPYNDSYSGSPSEPLNSALVACKGVTGQNGCNDPLVVDTPPYTIPQWFLKSQYGNLLNNKPNIARFTIPGNWIPSTGLYAFTFYVNYNQQAAPESDMSDNTKTIYLNAAALQQ